MHSLFSSTAICRWQPSLRWKSTFPHRHYTIHLLQNVAVPHVVYIPSCVSSCGCYASERLRKETPNTGKHQKILERKATKESNRGSDVAGDEYGHVAARWRATGMGARKRGGGRWVEARGSAGAGGGCGREGARDSAGLGDGYGREAVRWWVSGTARGSVVAGGFNIGSTSIVTVGPIFCTNTD